MKDGVINYSGVLASGLVGLLLVPILYHGLAREEYGIWIAGLAVAGMARGLDFGLNWSIIREVAAQNGEATESLCRFLVTAGNAYLIMGFSGAAVIATLGLPLSAGLHLSAAGRTSAHTVFALVGISFLAEQLILFASGVLWALRRFGTVSSVAAVTALLRAGGIVALLRTGNGLIAITVWYASATAIVAPVSLVIVARLLPGIQFRVGEFDWRLLRGHVFFSVASQLVTASVKLVWETAPLLVGLVLGSVSIVPYYLGQKFPLAVSGVTWRVAEALYPAASAHQHPQDMAQTREVLQVGTRWTVVLALPLCLVLVIVAPDLLQAWLGRVGPDTVRVLRLTAAAVLVDAFGVAALHVLWGRGAAHRVLAVVGGAGLVSVTLSLGLLRSIGIMGVAWALLVASALGSLASVYLACRACTVDLPWLVRATLKGLFAPALASAAATAGFVHFAHPSRWGGVTAAALIGGVTCVVCLYLFGAREEERRFIREVLALPITLTHFGYLGVRRIFRRVGFLRSGWYLAIAMMNLIRNRWSAGAFDREFLRRRDPWGYDTPEEQKRLLRALEMLDAARGMAPFRQAFEIGCAEGAFTELLMDRCASLLAVDFSSVALQRARGRCRWHDGVRFEQWDLCQDPLPGASDLIVVMGVLDYFDRPSALRAARTKLVAGLSPGGYLLVGNTRQAELFESAWWGRRLIRGGKWMNQFMAEHPELSVVESATEPFYVMTLLRKVA